MIIGVPVTAGASAPARSTVPHSIVTAVSNNAPLGTAVTTRSALVRKANAGGTPSWLPTTTEPPRRSRARASARPAPRQSPSGLVWQTIRVRVLVLRAWAMAARTSTRLLLCHLSEQGGNAGTALDRVIEAEVELWHRADRQPVAQLRADVPGGPLETLHR